MVAQANLAEPLARPRRFLFSCTGGYGHFHPLVPLARALKQAGHEVAFAAGRSLKPLVEAAGFTAFPMSGNLDADPQYRQLKAQLEKMPSGLETEFFIFSKLFCGVTPRLRTPDLVAIARTWQPDMLIREGGEYGAVIAAEHLGLPHAVVSFAASLQGMALFEREAAAELDPLRQQWGLAPDPHLTSLYRYLCLSYSPPGFSLQAAGGPQLPNFIPATNHFIRPDFFDGADQQSLPDWFAQMSAQPIVYLTMGTEVNNTPEFYPVVLQKIIAGLREMKLNLIVTLGRDKDPADFGSQPANVHIERYIPQSLLLKKCDLMVMHGGSNSLLAALDVGLPLVIVPLIADQFFNAHITQSLQVGQVVQLEQLTPENVRRAVEEVLANPIYRQNAARLQTEMHSLPDMTHAVELVERVVASGQAVLNLALTTNPPPGPS